MQWGVAPPHCPPARSRAADSTDARPPGTLRQPRRRDGQLGKGRIEAFSDGVIAIIITIMVLELRPPEGTTLEALRALGPVFVSYVAELRVRGHLLEQPPPPVPGRPRRRRAGAVGQPVPAVLAVAAAVRTAWMGEHEFAAVPVALYGVILLAAAVAYFVLVRTLLRSSRRAPGSPRRSATTRRARSRR